MDRRMQASRVVPIFDSRVTLVSNFLSNFLLPVLDMLNLRVVEFSKGKIERDH